MLIVPLDLTRAIMIPFPQFHGLQPVPCAETVAKWAHSVWRIHDREDF